MSRSDTYGRTQSISPRPARRHLRLPCLLVKKAGRLQFTPVCTLHPVPPRAAISGSWALVCDPAITLREAQATAPAPEVLARCLRLRQADAFCADFRAVHLGELSQ